MTTLPRPKSFFGEHDNIMSRMSRTEALFRALDSYYRKKILTLCFERPYNVLELQREIGLAGYGNLRRHLNILETAGLIKLEKNFRASGRPVIVRACKKKFAKKMFNTMMRDMKKIQGDAL